MRRFSKMTKEMRPFHRIDVLSDALGHFAYRSSMNLGMFLLPIEASYNTCILCIVGDILVERMKKAHNVLQSTSRDLETLRTDSSGGIHASVYVVTKH